MHAQRRPLMAASAALIAALLAVVAAPTAAAPVTTGELRLWRDHEGPNTVGTGTGDNLTVVVRNVSPNLTTFGFAGNPAAPQPVPLLNLFTSTFGFFSRSLANDVSSQGGVITGPWQVTLQNRGDIVTAQTNDLVGIGQLPLLQNLTVSGNSLAPTLSWDPVTTSVPYQQVRLSIFDDRTNQVIVNEQVIGGAGLTGYSVPVGILAPNTDYAFRVFLWDQDGPSGFVVNRSSTHVNHTSTSSAATSGSVQANTATGTILSLTLAPGPNSFADGNVAIGSSAEPAGAGAVTLKPGTTLDTSLLTVGVNRLGTMVIDGTTATMNGATSEGISGWVSVGHIPGGIGYMDIYNGGQLLINSSDMPFARLEIGRHLGSFGTVNVDGAGSRIVITGPVTPASTPDENGTITIGRIGDGRLNVLNGAVVENDARGVSNVGRDAGSRGSLLVAGAGSQFKGGAQLNIGVGGEAAVQVQDGGLVSADNILLGAGGLLAGDGGVINVAGALTVAGGVLSPGNSPGTMTIDGDLKVNSGTLLMEAFGPGEIDQLIVTGDLYLDADAELAILLDFDPASPLSFFTVGGAINIEDGFSPTVYGRFGGRANVGSTVQVQIGNSLFDVQVQGVVSTPGTLALVVLAAFAGLARRWAWLADSLRCAAAPRVARV